MRPSLPPGGTKNKRFPVVPLMRPRDSHSTSQMGAGAHIWTKGMICVWEDCKALCVPNRATPTTHKLESICMYDKDYLKGKYAEDDVVTSEVKQLRKLLD